MLINAQDNFEIDSTQVLKFLSENSMIDLNGVLDNMKKQKINNILANHKYKIFQDTDQRWKTTLPDETKKNGRRLVAKTNYDDLVAEIVRYYENFTVQNKLTLRIIYPEWLQYKNLHTNSTSYIRRIQNDWNKYYENDEIVDNLMTELSYIQLDEWSHNLIKKYSLNKKQYYNLTLIIRQCFDYAIEKYNTVIKENPFQRVKIDPKMFTPTLKPQSKTQIFTENEQIAICQLALKHYRKRPKSISGLAIALNFYLGLRIGELVALKWSDISEDNYIHIQKTEIMDYDVKEDKISRIGTKVVNRTKSFAGDREIYLVSDARKILSMIKERNDKYNLHDDDFIFVTQNSKRLDGGKVNDYLYLLCDELGIERKSTHKIRKTFISGLFDKGFNIDAICRMSGHADEKTTLHTYCFDLHDKGENEQKMESMSKLLISS